MTARVLIVGAGHGGGTVTHLLRQGGYEGEIVLAGEELALPYQRPPLSKAYLKRDVGVDALLLRPEEFYTAHNITLQLGVRAGAVDAARKIVSFDGAASLVYDTLILATGSRARALAIGGVDAKGVYALRTLADADAIGAALGPGKRLAVIGGGYIGLEVAASARSLGAEAVVIEREARCLARVASHALSDLYHEHHRAHGVEIIVGANVEELETANGHVAALRLQDGRRIACDAALIGVGAAACDELTLEAGLSCDGGVIVDAQARTSDPNIFAIGDMTRRPLPLYEGRLGRLESVPNVLEQAKQASAAILGKPQPAPEVPWFWSDQYDLKLQIAGLPFDVDNIVVRRGGNGALAVYHLRGDVVRAVEAVNSPGDFVLGKKAIGERMPVSAARLGDVSIPIKEALAAPRAS